MRVLVSNEKFSLYVFDDGKPWGRVNGPAFVRYTGEFQWFRRGMPHRFCGIQCSRPNGTILVGEFGRLYSLKGHVKSLVDVVSL